MIVEIVVIVIIVVVVVGIVPQRHHLEGLVPAVLLGVLDGVLQHLGQHGPADGGYVVGPGPVLAVDAVPVVHPGLVVPHDEPLVVPDDDVAVIVLCRVRLAVSGVQSVRVAVDHERDGLAVQGAAGPCRSVLQGELVLALGVGVGVGAGAGTACGRGCLPAVAAAIAIAGLARIGTLVQRGPGRGPVAEGQGGLLGADQPVPAAAIAAAAAITVAATIAAAARCLVRHSSPAAGIFRRPSSSSSSSHHARPRGSDPCVAEEGVALNDVPGVEGGEGREDGAGEHLRHRSRRRRRRRRRRRGARGGVVPSHGSRWLWPASLVGGGGGGIVSLGSGDVMCCVPSLPRLFTVTRKYKYYA